MTQQDIRNHYETQWKSTSDAADDTSGLGYSDAIEDGVLYPCPWQERYPGERSRIGEWTRGVWSRLVTASAPKHGRDCYVKQFDSNHSA